MAKFRYRPLVTCGVFFALIACTNNPYQFTESFRLFNTPFAAIDEQKDLSSTFKSNFCKSISTEAESTACTQYFYPYPNDNKDGEVTHLRDIDDKAKYLFVIVPGILGECIIDEVAPFEKSIPLVSEKYPNIRFHTIKTVSGRASSTYNSKTIYTEIERLETYPEEKIIIVGYSKGATDSLVYFSDYYFNPSVKNTKIISGFVTISGVILGTPIANTEYLNSESIVANFPIDTCPTKDESGVNDLSNLTRFEWFKQQYSTEISNIPSFSLISASTRKNTSLVFNTFHKDIMTMAGINDGQVPASMQFMPNSYYLGTVNADHWAVILPFSDHESSNLTWLNKLTKKVATKNTYPREALLEALVLTVASKIH
ncbi:hypothetical protein tloyanaT_14160 [Thalassotalea loyana]|uniref:Alpha/beta hydrolase n=1 Tax=Thalassotalea loyana TaxID=280483 RepID=A0ABQ6HC98_9GAMM|nr:hypothetical protein [Thalassotalea loyana]GLX85164.1 hypothetical protein tloyanaT_14160 [Thalassotalea loyana]